MKDQRDILVFGCSALGQAVMEQLNSRNYTPNLFSDDTEAVGDLIAKGYDAAYLDYMDDENLRSVGIGEWVKTIFCLFSEESKNVFLTLSVRAGLQTQDRLCLRISHIGTEADYSRCQ